MLERVENTNARNVFNKTAPTFRKIENMYTIGNLISNQSVVF